MQLIVPDRDCRRTAIISLAEATLAAGREISVRGRDVLNDRMIPQIFDSPARPGLISGYPKQLRTCGVAARFRF